jgi:predicted  nucleic acid-binding Zn-ribbon protein
MDTTNPVEKIKNEISSLQTRVNWLQDKANLSNTRDTLEDMHTQVRSLDQKIKDLRTRGYVFGKDLETQAADYEKQWASLYPSVSTQINQMSANLQMGIRPIENQMVQLTGLASNPAAARPLLDKTKAAVEALEKKANSAERTVNGMYDSLRRQVQSLGTHLSKVDRMLKELAQASFQLLASEAGIMAVKAVWAKNGKEQKGDPEGVLYLTDQRLLFEQKEEIATRKVLFVATEKEKVQKLLLEAPVALVEAVAISKQGMLKNEDFIEIKFAVGAPVREAQFHIWQPCEEWQALVQRAKAKEFDKDRAVPIDREALEKVRSAPSQCPSCGGNIDKVILRGQDEIKCEYCGFVIRL